MTILSKLAVAVSIVISAGIVMLVHNEQEKDRIRLHQGVLLDQERQARKLDKNRGDSEEEAKSNLNQEGSTEN